MNDKVSIFCSIIFSILHLNCIYVYSNSITITDSNEKWKLGSTQISDPFIGKFNGQIFGVNTQLQIVKNLKTNMQSMLTV